MLSFNIIKYYNVTQNSIFFYFFPLKKVNHLKMLRQTALESSIMGPSLEAKQLGISKCLKESK